MSFAGKPTELGALVIGTNHRQAPVEFRERVTFAPDEIQRFVQRARGALRDSECFMMSTCNRTEVYIFNADPNRAAPRLRQILAESKSLDMERDERCFYEYRDRAALEHLYRVASGLDSMALGETQILQQVQEAFETCLGADAL